MVGDKRGDLIVTEAAFKYYCNRKKVCPDKAGNHVSIFQYWL